MRVKLSVVHTERGGEARAYVLEQDSIVIGRAGTCDLPLDDPDRVVSKQHAEIRAEGDALRVFDMGSKNHTFVEGARVGTTGTLLADGAKLQLGPFEITVEIDRDRLVADDLDRTVFGAAFANPFAEQAEAVASALGDLRQAFRGLDYGHRAEALHDALREALGPGGDASALTDLIAPGATARADAPSEPQTATPLASAVPAQHQAAPPPSDAPAGDPLAEADLDDLFGPPLGTDGKPVGTDDGPSSDVGSDDPFGPPETTDPIPVTPPAVPSSEPAIPVAAGPDELHRALAAVVARLISIPGQFRHEFLGQTVIHAPETAFLFDADVDALLRHLTPDDPSLRAERLAILDRAAEGVLQHHQSLLEGYRAAAREGAEVLVNGLDPNQLASQAEGGGLLGSKDKALVDLIRQRCEMMRGEDFAAAERRVYRPAFSRAYLDAMAYAHATSSTP